MSFSVSTNSAFSAQFKYSLSGEVISGMDVVTAIEGYGSQSGAPKKEIKIVASGIV